MYPYGKRKKTELMLYNSIHISCNSLLGAPAAANLQKNAKFAAQGPCGNKFANKFWSDGEPGLLRARIRCADAAGMAAIKGLVESPLRTASSDLTQDGLLGEEPARHRRLSLQTPQAQWTSRRLEAFAGTKFEAAG